MPPAMLPLFSRPVLLTSAVWVVLNVVLGVTGYTPEGFGAAVAWEAHLGGFFSAVFILLFLRPEAYARYLSDTPV